MSIFTRSAGRVSLPISHRFTRFTPDLDRYRSGTGRLRRHVRTYPCNRLGHTMTQPDLAGTRAEDGAGHSQAAIRECARHRLTPPPLHLSSHGEDRCHFCSPICLLFSFACSSSAFQTVAMRIVLLPPTSGARASSARLHALTP